MSRLQLFGELNTCSLRIRNAGSSASCASIALVSSTSVSFSSLSARKQLFFVGGGEIRGALGNLTFLSTRSLLAGRQPTRSRSATS
jgi:hypothetical protein